MRKETQRDKKKETLKEKINNLIEDSNITGATIVCTDDCESLDGKLGDVLKSALSVRGNVVMVRVNKASLEKLDELVEAGIVNSRSESAALLITEGIKSKQAFFNQISKKLERIRETREEIRHLL
jgi:hypothetical protein